MNDPKSTKMKEKAKTVKAYGVSKNPKVCPKGIFVKVDVS
jgi:hypothetical protein